MKWIFSFTVIVTLLFSGCVTPIENRVFQTSTIDALLAGVYDGDMSCGSLLNHGDFGIGTFDHLDGEMIVLDGAIYQVKSDGKVYRPLLSSNTPFATVCQFSSDKTASIPEGINYKKIKGIIDKLAPNKNIFCAIKIKGEFLKMKTRSVPGQKKPYPPLKQVTKHQPEFEMENIGGTIVGFRCPSYVKGINVPGYHLHFISNDRRKGGHILSFEIKQATCDVDIINNYLLVLPRNQKEFAETNLSKDRTQDLKDVEQEKE